MSRESVINTVKEYDKRVIVWKEGVNGIIDKETYNYGVYKGERKYG